MTAPRPLLPPTLTSKARRQLRALAHHRDPVVQIGQQGFTEAVAEELARALDAHELLKVKLGKECPEDAGELASRLATELGAHTVQTIGRVMVVYRRHPEEPRIDLGG